MNKIKKITIFSIFFLTFFLFSTNIKATSCESGGLIFLFQNENLKVTDGNGILKMCGASDNENCYELISSQTKIEKAIQNQSCNGINVKQETIKTDIGEKTKYIVSVVGNTEGNTGISNGETISCGNISGIPARIPQITSKIILLVQVIVPILLVIFGMLDFLKAVVAQKDDEIKKGQKMFLKRLIVGILVFFIIVIVKLVINIVAGVDASGIIECMDCFLSNNC